MNPPVNTKGQEFSETGRASNPANLKRIAGRDVLGQATEEERAMLRAPANVRRWYGALKELRAEAESERVKHKEEERSYRKECEGPDGNLRRDALRGWNQFKRIHDERGSEIGQYIYDINQRLSEARQLVKDLNIKEAALRAGVKPSEHQVSPSLLLSSTPLAGEEPENGSEALLRGDLRAARRMMRRCYDFLRDDANVTFRAMDARDGLLEDLERELRGT